MSGFFMAYYLHDRGMHYYLGIPNHDLTLDNNIIMRQMSHVKYFIKIYAKI